MEGSIAHFLALIHTLYIIITKFIASASSCQLSHLSSLVQFVLALVEEKLSPMNSLYLSTQLSLKILAKQSKTAKKMLAFDC